MDAKHLPQVIGCCSHCGLPLYAGSPKVSVPLAHVACEVDARRR